jgi:hypothetical protein
LPDEYGRCLVGLTSVLKKAWNTASNAKKQARENTNIIISKGLLWNETRITYSCHSDGWRRQVCFWKATTTDIRPFPTILDPRKPSVKTWITPNLKIESLLNQTSLHDTVPVNVLFHSCIQRLISPNITLCDNYGLKNSKGSTLEQLMLYFLE